VDFISDFSPRYRREQRRVHLLLGFRHLNRLVPGSCRAAEACQRIRRSPGRFAARGAWMWASAARVLVACQLADQ